MGARATAALLSPCSVDESGAAASVTTLHHVVQAHGVNVFRKAPRTSARFVTFQQGLGSCSKDGVCSQGLPSTHTYEAASGVSMIRPSFGSSSSFRACLSSTTQLNAFQHSKGAGAKGRPLRSDTVARDGGYSRVFQASSVGDIGIDDIGAVKVTRKPRSAEAPEASTVLAAEKSQSLDAGQVEKRPRKVRGRPPLLTATPAAVRRIKELVLMHNGQQEQQQLQPRAVGIRISLEKQGCSGMSYQVGLCYEPTADVQSVTPKEGIGSNLKVTSLPVQTAVPVQSGRAFLPADEVVRTNGVEIRVAPEAVGFVLGTEVDFVDEETQTGFVFKNPNQKHSCGCGKSFMV